MVNAWIDIEEDPEVVNAVVDDELDALESDDLPPKDNDDEEPESMETEEDTETFSYLELEEMLKKIKQGGRKLNVSEQATVHLDRYAKALQTAKLQKPKKDTTLHSFFSSKK